MGGSYSDSLKIGSPDWDGQLDEVAYYCCALSAEDVRSHYGDLTTYDYDEVYQVTDVVYPDSDTETFTYDAMGNRLTRVFNGSTTNYTYNAGERMTAAGGVTYTYDDNGNLTDRGATDDFGWDHDNHLTSTIINGVSSTYDYNGDGLRMSRTIGGTTVDYVWDLARDLPVILEDGDGVRYVHGLDLIARIDGSTEEYYLPDGLGSTTALTDDTGAVTDTYEYDGFGNIRTETGSSTNEFTYAGEQVDPTDLQFLRARYYDPAVGRFLSEDPLPLMQRYAYVGNNPVNFVDHSGLCYRASTSSQDCWSIRRDGSRTRRPVPYEGGNFGEGCQASVVGDVGIGLRPRAGLGVGVATGGRIAASFDSCRDVAFVGSASAGGGATFLGGVNIISASLLVGGGNSDREGAGGTAGGCAWWGLGGCVAFTGGEGIGGIQVELGVGVGVQFFGTIDYNAVWDWRPW